MVARPVRTSSSPRLAFIIGITLLIILLFYGVKYPSRLRKKWAPTFDCTMPAGHVWQLPKAFRDAQADLESLCLRKNTETGNQRGAGSSYQQATVYVGAEPATLSLPMWTYKKGKDYVSNRLVEDGRWEQRETEQILGRLEAFRQAHNLTRRQTVLMDIGANVGWYTVSAAAQGFSVVAVEPLAANLGALRRTLCGCPALAHSVFLFPTGLSDAPKTCRLYSLPENRGNGVTVCEGEGQEGSQGPPEGMALQGQFELTTLDALLPPDTLAELAGRVAVLKIDVEGHEPLVWAGGRKFVAAVQPQYIFAEINGPALKANGFTPEDMFKQYDALGYDLHIGGFDAPADHDFSTLAQRSQAATRDANFYLTRKPGA